MSNLDRSFYGGFSKDQLLGTIQRITKALNNGITFGRTSANDAPYSDSSPPARDAKNIAGFKATGTTPAGVNTEFTINHNLAWVPWFYFYDLDRAGQLYQLPATGTAWTAATNGNTNGTIHLKCTAASANYAIFII